MLQAGVVFTFAIELLLPFLILMPRRPRQFAAGAITLFQLTIMATGSYNYFNILTLCLCLLLLDDQFLRRWGPIFVQRWVTRKRAGGGIVGENTGGFAFVW